MPRINPYIHFNDNAEEAFNFYKSVFGSEFARIARYRDFASMDNQVPEKEGNKLAHIALPIGNSPCGTYFGMFRDKYGIEWMIDYMPR